MEDVLVAQYAHSYGKFNGVFILQPKVDTLLLYRITEGITMNKLTWKSR